MKKILLVILLLTSPVFAARALLMSIESVGAYTDPPAATVVRWSLKVAYQGPDVSGTVQTARITVNVSTSTTLGQLQSAITSAVQAEATSRGFTVASGSTTMPTYGNQ